MKKGRIFLVEDNPGDVALVEHALQRSGSTAALSVARDGESAVEALKAMSESELPDLILLDLNLPRLDGRDVLAAIKRDNRMALVPVVVLSSSDAPKDVCMAYRQHANSYVMKPVEADDFFRVIESLDGYWLGTVERPENCE